MNARRFVADLDASSAMLRALARFLHGRDFPALGTHPRTSPVFEALLPAINRLSVPLREAAYLRSAVAEAVPPRTLARFDAEAHARWVVGRYPRGRYPAAVVGASNGALIHLCAALGIPWLPQTLRLSLRHAGSVPIDEPLADLTFATEPARTLLEDQPDLQLHHLHDADQDRLPLRGVSRLHLKRRVLGDTYRQFLEESLEPGATLFVSECTLRWPTLRLGPHHVFQHGSLGGATPHELLHGGPRVRDFLQRQGSDFPRWPSPPFDGDSPEAEWGFEPALLEDLARLARERRWRLRRIVYPEPEALSPLVADLHRHWFRARHIPVRRLLVESFILMEPWWALRTGAVPFWLACNQESSARALEQYLDVSEPWDEQYLMLYSHGVESINLASMERWRGLLARAVEHAALLGVDPVAYPRDFATLVRYHPALKRELPARHSARARLSLDAFDAFLREHGERYAVGWEELDTRPVHRASQVSTWLH
ncbi:hypothetical protein LZ198_33165 [Myxococcus sp. K15C18031901]|uniref:hypothetical protein n=1 Tax=Myxococcus dinghuensis TaxID=2906761 RepID=UPI0020A81FCD|nr:hypothetical protein [Myxococcus dinghuensis]MCP3103745.1 hypothetical protein [Myxococcus dinghuensis]